MGSRVFRACGRIGAVAAFCVTLAVPAAAKNLAVVAAVGSKLQDVSLANLAKLCKGTAKAWPDGKNFTLVMKDPESPEMQPVVQKIYNMTPAEVKQLIAKLNDSRPQQPYVKIVTSDDEVLRTVAATPGAVGILDVYAINSTVKVLRLDGNLPFDSGYVLKGNSRAYQSY